MVTKYHFLVFANHIRSIFCKSLRIKIRSYLTFQPEFWSIKIFGCCSMTRFLLENLKWYIYTDLTFLVFFNFSCQNSCRSSKRHRNLEEFWTHMISLMGVLGELMKEVALAKVKWDLSVWWIFKVYCQYIKRKSYDDIFISQKYGNDQKW